MKKATAHPQYSDVHSFSAPPGVTGVLLDKNTNLRATAKCPETYTAVFISGTEPQQTCEDGSRSLPGMALRLLGIDPKPLPPVLVSNGIQETEGAVRADAAAETEKKKKKKKGFFGRIFGGSDNEEEEESKPQPPPAPPPKTAPQAGKDPAPAPH